MAFKPRYSKKSKKPMKRTRKLKVNKSISPAAVYKFKRAGPEVFIYHQSGDAGNVWQIRDAGSLVNSTFASNTAWTQDLLPGTYYNGFSMSKFKLSQIQQPTDFTNLYDRYKIDKIKVTFLYQHNDSSVGGQGILPTMYYCVDYDDANVPTYAQIRQKQYLRQKILLANKPFSVTFRPKRLVTQSDIDVTSNSMITNVGYTNCDNSTVNHLGLKFYLDHLYSGLPATTTVNSMLQIQTTYYMSFKDPQ